MALYGDLTYDSRVRKEARSLAEAGYDVVIVCLASDGVRTDLPANVTVLVRLPSGAFVAPGSSAALLVARAGRIDRIRKRASWLIAYARGLRRWGRLAVEAAGPVDAWHAHDLTGLAAIAPSLHRGVPLVYDSHELYLESGPEAALPRFARWILRYYEKRLVSGAAAVITVNDEIAVELVRRYRPRGIAVLHNCPVLAAPEASGSVIRDTTGIPAGACIVLYHGSLISGRGIESLMVALLGEGLDDVQLVLMGYGAMREELTNLTRSEPWRHRMHVLDPVPPSALQAWVSGADVGVMVNPGRTLNDFYSSPNKLFECLAAGTPVVASDFPTLRRIIMDNPGGQLGAVCDPGDVEAIATSIRSILRLAPDEMGALRTRCRRAAEERWNWDLEAQTLLSVYANLGLHGLKSWTPSAGAREETECRVAATVVSMITRCAAASVSKQRARCEVSMHATDRSGTFYGRVVVMFGTQIVTAAIGILNGIFLARLLGPAGRGDYYLLLLLPTTMMILLQLGLPQAFEFFSARGQTVGLVTKSFMLTLALSTFGFVVVIALLPALQEAILHGISLELVLLAFLVLPLILHAPFSAAIVIGRQAVRWYAAIKLSQPLVTTVLLVVVLGVLGQGVAGALVVFFIVAMINTVGFIIGAVRVSRTVPGPGVAPFRQIIGYGLRFYPGSLSGFFSYRTDAYLIAFLLADPSESLGYYSMAVAFAEMIFLFPSAVATIFFPHVAGSPREDVDRQVALVSRVTLLVSGVFALLLIPCAMAMIWAVLPAFDQSIPPFLVLLPGVVALSGANVVDGYVTGIGRPGINSIVSIGALGVNIVANLVLIPRLGILGAASASLLSYTLSSLVLTSVAARLSGTPLWRFWIPSLADVRFVAATSATLVRRGRNRGEQGEGGGHA